MWKSFLQNMISFGFRAEWVSLWVWSSLRITGLVFFEALTFVPQALIATYVSSRNQASVWAFVLLHRVLLGLFRMTVLVIALVLFKYVPWGFAMFFNVMAWQLMSPKGMIFKWKEKMKQEAEKIHAQKSERYVRLEHARLRVLTGGRNQSVKSRARL